MFAAVGSGLSSAPAVGADNGSVSIAATPGTKAPPANRPQIPWLGLRLIRLRSIRE
jgi:hypothetical protein